MKKKLIVLFTAVLAISMIGCNGAANSDSGESGGSGKPETQIGTKAPTEQKAVGDIIFADGSATGYTTELTLTDKQKSKAIAVIYKVDGSKAYGVGLVHSNRGLVWCLESANGYNKIFEDLKCEVNGLAGDLSFSGDTDGSDNFSKIKQALGTNNDTGTTGNYPAFEFAENYKKQQNSHVSGTAYEDKWYLPTMSELFDIWKVKSTVDAASRLCDGSVFSNNWYWSSTQHDTSASNALILIFGSGMSGNYAKKTVNVAAVCCIRVFD